MGAGDFVQKCQYFLKRMKVFFSLDFHLYLYPPIYVEPARDDVIDYVYLSPVVYQMSTVLCCLSMCGINKRVYLLTHGVLQ